MHTVILTEGGDGIGLGHIMRMIALKKKIEKNVDVECYINIIGDIGKTLLQSSFVKLDWQLNSHLIPNCEQIIIDSYLASTECYASFKNKTKRIIAIDDYNRIIYPVDLIINPNLFAIDMNYSNQKTKVFNKGGCFFSDEVELSKSKYCVRPVINNLLITVGGSDYKRLIPRLISSLTQRYKNIDIIGSKKDLVKLNNKKNLHLHYDLSKADIVKLFLKSDLVISGAGQTLHDLIYLGVPTIPICIDFDQQRNIAFYKKKGVIDTEIDLDNLESSLNSALRVFSKYSVRSNFNNRTNDIVFLNIMNEIYNYLIQ